MHKGLIEEGNDALFIESEKANGGQKIKLTKDEINEIEDLIERFYKEPESVTSAERIIRELDINGKSCRLKVIIEVEEDCFEDRFTD